MYVGLFKQAHSSQLLQSAKPVLVHPRVSNIYPKEGLAHRLPQVLDLLQLVDPSPAQAI